MVQQKKSIGKCDSQKELLRQHRAIHGGFPPGKPFTIDRTTFCIFSAKLHKSPTSVACCNKIHYCLLSKNSFRIGLFDEKSDVQRAAGGAQSELCGVALSTAMGLLLRHIALACSAWRAAQPAQLQANPRKRGKPLFKSFPPSSFSVSGALPFFQVKGLPATAVFAASRIQPFHRIFTAFPNQSYGDYFCLLVSSSDASSSDDGSSDASASDCSSSPASAV